MFYSVSLQVIRITIKDTDMKRLLLLLMVMVAGITMWADEGYAVFTSSNSTLTFYYGTKPSGAYSVGGTNEWPSWSSIREDVKRVVFDPSFAQARPQTTYYWFYHMKNLTTITGLDYLNTSEVTNMHGMFCHCENLVNLDLHTFNTEKVTEMDCMFEGCYELESLNVSGFNTTNAEIDFMFNSCFKLKTLDLRSFDTANKTNLTRMFDCCRELTTIYVGDGWNTEAVTSSDDMFRYCYNLKGMRGTTFDGNHTDKEYARIDGGPDSDIPGYLSSAPRGFKHNDLWYEEISNTAVALIEPQNGDIYTGEVIIPDFIVRGGQPRTVTKIAPMAFMGTAVTSVEVSSSVSQIGKRAFYGAKNLKTLVLNSDKTPSKYTLLDDNIMGDNTSDFVCYVKNSLLSMWIQKYPTVSFLPWVKTPVDDGFMTFSSTLDVTLPDGLAAYCVTGFNAERRLATTTKLSSKTIPYNNGVVLKGELDTRYLLLAATAAPGLGDNMLRPLVDVEDIPYAPFASSPDDSKSYFLAHIGTDTKEWREFQNSIDLFLVLNTGVAYLAVDKALLGGDYTSPVQLDLWSNVQYPLGDVDGDFKVDISDVNAAINIILELKDPGEYRGSANITGGDNKVDIADVNAIINIILYGYPSQPVTFTVNGVSFKMVSVDGGTFAMGATAEQGDDANYANYKEKPVHWVTLSSYSIGATEVTQELWQAVMGSNPSTYNGGSYGTNLQRPVECVSWSDSQEFITKLNQLTGKNFRLPTEAEWEYAARGGNHSMGYKYAGSNTVGDVAWYWYNIPSRSNGSAGYGTQPVGTKAPNELGVYDMSGNVYEWCQDWYSSYTSEAQTNPTGPATGTSRVYRGGSWDNEAWFSRVSARWADPDDGFDNLGLRLVLSE